MRFEADPDVALLGDVDLAAMIASPKDATIEGIFVARQAERWPGRLARSERGS